MLNGKYSKKAWRKKRVWLVMNNKKKRRKKKLKLVASHFAFAFHTS